MSSGLWGMAGLGLLSTSKISTDNRSRFELGWAEYEQQSRYLDIRERELQQQQSSQQNLWSLWNYSDSLYGYGDTGLDDFEAEQGIYHANALERINLEAQLQSQRDDQYFQRQIALNQQDILAQQNLQQSGYANQLALADLYHQQNLTRDDLDYQRRLAQTSLIHAGDTMLQDQRLLVQTHLQDVELQQEQEEVNRYLKERIYKEQHSFNAQFGNETDVNKLSFILIKLKEMLPKHALHNAYLPDNPEYNPSGQPDFDYARWDEIPEERLIP